MIKIHNIYPCNMVNNNLDSLLVASLLGLAGYTSSDEDDLPSPLLKSPNSLHKPVLKPVKPVSKPVKPDSTKRSHGQDPKLTDPRTGNQKDQVSYFFLDFLASIVIIFSSMKIEQESHFKITF